MARATVQATCHQCGSTFFPLLSEVNRGCGKFCSRQCLYTGRIRKKSTHVSERFNQSKWIADDSTGCWNWTGKKKPHGYGVIKVNSKEEVLAHRIAWMLSFGGIPAGMCVCHRCDNPSCVNPSHLFLGFQADNIADMVMKSRQRGNLQPKNRSKDGKFCISGAING